MLYRLCFSATKIESMAVSRATRSAVVLHADICSSRPILTPKTVLPLFFAVGIIFAPLGGLMLYASDKVCGEMLNG